MALYEPQQDLTWKYISNTGQLIIVTTIRADLAAGERVNPSVTSALNNTYLVGLNVVSGTNNMPVVVDIPYTIITSGLTDVDQVRQIIAGLASASVQTTVYKSGAGAGSVSGSTSAEVEINIE